MSKAQEFLKKAAEDKALQEKMTAIMEGKPEEISDKVVALAKENGFEITFDEFLKEVKGQEGEVSDDELDNVAGGYRLPMAKCPICGRRVLEAMINPDGTCLFCNLFDN